MFVNADATCSLRYMYIHIHPACVCVSNNLFPTLRWHLLLCNCMSCVPNVAKHVRLHQVARRAALTSERNSSLTGEAWFSWISVIFFSQRLAADPHILSYLIFSDISLYISCKYRFCLNMWTCTYVYVHASTDILDYMADKLRHVETHQYAAATWVLLPFHSHFLRLSQKNIRKTNKTLVRSLGGLVALMLNSHITRPPSVHWDCMLHRGFI